MSQTCIGLTGGIASGKSALERAFLARASSWPTPTASRGAVVEARHTGAGRIVAHFGADVLDAQAGLDRAAMRRRVFEDENARQALEAIVHPPCARRWRRSAAPPPARMRWR